MLRLRLFHNFKSKTNPNPNPNPNQGKEMLRLFHNFKSKTSILDDFCFYDKRQELMELRLTLTPTLTPALNPTLTPTLTLTLSRSSWSCARRWLRMACRRPARRSPSRRT